MKKKRFSRQHLFDLRNHININQLISDILRLPSKHREGYLRFVCPVCGETLTATNPKTNLARCFRCQRNFNTIDLVMLEHRSSFVEAVSFLSQYLPRQ